MQYQNRPILGWKNATTSASPRSSLLDRGWFDQPGAYAVVDGQFGSTGKGLICGYLGGYFYDRITHYTTNAGPNSGHTSYFHGDKVMLQQLPMGAVIAAKVCEASGRVFQGFAHLNSGAIIDPTILFKEISDHGMSGAILIDPFAAIITDFNKSNEKEPGSGTAKIASTGKGVGDALAMKVLREGTIFSKYIHAGLDEEDVWPGSARVRWNWDHHIVMVEVSQGFSLGLNSGFYPYTTSRECTVMQAISDARIPPRRLKKTLATFRTFPIRVGNTDLGHSGDCYPDQKEITWADLGQEPEYTSVTNRVRRVFTWSDMQFVHCLEAQEPDALFLNFMNYLKPEEMEPFVQNVLDLYQKVLHRQPDFLALGYGPEAGDVEILYRG